MQSLADSSAGIVSSVSAQWHDPRRFVLPAGAEMDAVQAGAEFGHALGRLDGAHQVFETVGEL